MTIATKAPIQIGKEEALKSAARLLPPVGSSSVSTTVAAAGAVLKLTIVGVALYFVLDSVRRKADGRPRR